MYWFLIHTRQDLLYGLIHKMEQLLLVLEVFINIHVKGTSVGAAQGYQDIQDDSVIAYSSNYCDLSLVKDVQELLFQLVGQIENIVFVGHSLGGTAAFCLTSQIQNSRGIGLNAGAAPTNPILVGPGNRFTQYHIFGDLISSHMSPNAAHVVIIKKSNTLSLFGTSKAHSSENILKSSGSWTFSNQTEEDEAFQKWGKSYSATYINNVSGRFISYLYHLKKSLIVQKNPIPGSKRANKQS